MAQRTGLEPATPGVTGRYSNRLNYRCASAGLSSDCKAFYQQPIRFRLARRLARREIYAPA